MTIRGFLPASAALLMLAGAPAHAAGELSDPFVPPEAPAQFAAARPPAVSPSPPIKFLWRLLAPKAHKEEVEAPAPVVAEPMILMPPAESVPERNASKQSYQPEPEPEFELPHTPEPKVSAARKVPIPIPRPRPQLPPSAVVAETAVADQVDSEEITGSIAMPQPESVAPAAVPQPETAPNPPPSVPPPVAASGIMDADDHLPGDPAQLLGEEKGLAPEIWVPENIAPPIPATGAPAASASPPPPRPAGEPYELMRTLQVLQDQIAQGSIEALAAQRALRVEMDRAFAAAAPAVWQDERNATAAVTYVLSGGPPSILRRLQTLDPKPPIGAGLISGVLAYAEGKEVEAEKQLAELDVARMAPSMGAQLALAKSALAVRTDPVAAMRFLAVARLLAPGTLVEEAALRREIFVADRLKDPTAVEELARQYLARFRNSVYAGNFRNRFAAAVSRMTFVNDQAGFERIEDLLLLVEPEARGQLYLTLALAAVVKGNSAAGAFAADHALALAPRASKEEARAQLYRAATMIADAEAFDGAVAALDRCNRKLLSASDQSLHDAVAATIAGVRQGTEVPAETKYMAALDGAKDGTAEMTPLMTRARDALGATDELVKGMAR